MEEGQIVAQIAPLPLSARERDEQRARVAAAEALAREAFEHVRRAENDLALARRERARVDALVQGGGLPAREADRTQNAATTAQRELEAARFRAASARAQVALARSGMVNGEGKSPGSEIIQLRAPISGRVLHIADTSERVVAAGTALLTLGDLKTLEVVIELLSSEAVRVEADMPAWIEDWGGRPLRGRVRKVEPVAATSPSPRA